jgi:membrane-associated phospholipid phosphatase
VTNITPFAPTRRTILMWAVSTHCVGFAACAWAYRATGLSLQGSYPASALLMAVAAVGWVLTYRRTQTDMAAAYLLGLTWGTLTVLAQYPAIAWGRPLVDGPLFQIDSALGLSVPALMAWTSSHHWATVLFGFAYQTFRWQLIGVITITGLARDRAALWEFLWHYQIVYVVAIVCCALWPASEPWAILQRPGLADGENVRAVMQIVTLHDGTLRMMDQGTPAGLVSFPSCHVAIAVLVCWALRRRSALLQFAVFVLNTLMIASTLYLGLHYGADVLGGAALATLSILTYQQVTARVGSSARLRLQGAFGGPPPVALGDFEAH